jgi:hypothetical protein
VVSVEPVIIAAATRCLTLDLAAEEVQAGVADSGVGPLFDLTPLGWWLTARRRFRRPARAVLKE